MRRTPLVIAMSLALFAGCRRSQLTTDPTVGQNLIGPEATRSSAKGGEDEVGSLENDDELGAELGEDTEEPETAEKPAAKLPPRAEPVTKCKGKGKKRSCEQVDPKPEISAAHGVVALLGDYRWGMSPNPVFKRMSADIEKEYEDRLAKATDPMDQDAAGKWRRQQINDLRANHVKFAKAANHRWGVSLIQFEYEDDNGEEMIYSRNDAGVRKFYFFKDGELWKIVYAYATDSFPGKSYEQVVDEKFKKWFGISPQAKVKQDPKTAAVMLRYLEWKASNGELIRAFDMSSVHGVWVLEVVDGKAEKRIGERLPNLAKKETTVDVVSDVLGGSDVCYDSSGSIRECESQ